MSPDEAEMAPAPDVELTPRGANWAPSRPPPTVGIASRPTVSSVMVRARAIAAGGRARARTHQQSSPKSPPKLEARAAVGSGCAARASY